MIHFNRPFIIGKELQYIEEAVRSGKISGDGLFTSRCQAFFERVYGFGRAFLTTSCTDALEMAAILCDIRPGDEVIAPSFTFVSTVNAFVLRGARIVFADCCEDIPNIDPDQIEMLITPRTKAMVVVHYAGIACDMDRIMDIARRHELYVVEDAAQSIDSHYKDRPLGGIGHLAAFSFHETKNVISGEGGMLAVNDQGFVKRAEIIREKGTDRSAFFRGEVDKYQWVDIGSSFLPSEIVAAFLYAQLEKLQLIQRQRKRIWERYYEGLKPLEEQGRLRLPRLPAYATNNAHMFFIVCNTAQERSALIAHLREREVLAVFHYQSLHKSRYYAEKHDGRALVNSDRYSDCLLRLPLYYALTKREQDHIIRSLRDFFTESGKAGKRP